jgi:hypothetical protein
MDPDLLWILSRAYRDQIMTELRRDRLAAQVPRARGGALRARLARRLHAMANWIEPSLEAEAGLAPYTLVRL